MLTREQVVTLGNALVDSTYDVYRVCEDRFPQAIVGEEVFDQLKEFSGIFRCVECNRWKSLNAKNPHYEDICQECHDFD